MVLRDLQSYLRRIFGAEVRSCGTTAVKVCNHIGNLHFRRNELKQAAVSYNLAIQYCADDSSNNEDRAVSHLNLGTVYWRDGDIPEAIWHLEKSLSLQSRQQKSSSSLETSLTAASVFHQLGLCHSLSGNIECAISALIKALNIQKNVHKGEASIEVARIYDVIGKVFARANRYDDAIVFYQKALDLYTRLNSPNRTTVLKSIEMVNQSKGIIAATPIATLATSLG